MSALTERPGPTGVGAGPGAQLGGGSESTVAPGSGENPLTDSERIALAALEPDHREHVEGMIRAYERTLGRRPFDHGQTDRDIRQRAVAILTADPEQEKATRAAADSAWRSLGRIKRALGAEPEWAPGTDDDDLARLIWRHRDISGTRSALNVVRSKPVSAWSDQMSVIVRHRGVDECQSPELHGFLELYHDALVTATEDYWRGKAEHYRQRVLRDLDPVRWLTVIRPRIEARRDWLSGGEVR